MVRVLIGPEHDAQRQACGFCETKVYHPCYRPNTPKGWSGWCARCGRYEQTEKDNCLFPVEPICDPDEVEAFDKRHRGKK